MKHLLRLYGYIVVIIIIYISLWIYISFYKTKFRTANNSDNMGVLRMSGEVSKVFINKTGKLPDWNLRCLLSNATDKSLLIFRQTITKKEFSILKDILATFKYACEGNNLTYMLYGGSLLGAYRHAGLIPWDDDVDIWMDYQQMTAAGKVLGKIPGYSLHRDKFDTNLWKLSSDVTKSANISQTGRRKVFPYIHILFFTANSTHIRHTEGVISNRTVFPINDIFPLKKILFEDEYYFVPNNMDAVIKRKYGQTDTCTARDSETLKDVIAVSCDKLYPYYPFITRSHIQNFQLETLTFGRDILWQRMYL